MREEIIRGLECRHRNPIGEDCENCHYGVRFARRWGCDFGRLCGDALALLKAQEPVEPVYGLGITRCGRCNHEIDKYGGDNYCPQCGKAVKWK